VNNKVGNIFIMFFVMILVVVVSGCDDSKAASNSDTRDKNSETTGEDTGATEMDKKNSETTKQDIQDFVLENTKMAKVFNINQKIHQKYPDLGPFQVVRGIDERGQKTEVWIKDNKIYEMINSNNNQQSTNNVDDKEENTVSKVN
jgi:uncharacterized protein YpmB